MIKWVVKEKKFPAGWHAWLTFNAYGDEFRYFFTWREAMDYADRMARTVSVVLPRRHVLPTRRHIVQKNGLIIEFEQSSTWPQLQPSQVVVEPEERRPLALALLALAEKEEVAE